MNKSLWNLYKNSERGKESIILFTFDIDNDDLEIKAKNIFQKYSEYLGGIEEEDYFLDRCFYILYNIVADNNLYIEDKEVSNDYFERLIDNLELFEVEENLNGDLVRIENTSPFIKQKDYKYFCSILSELSLILYFYGHSNFYPIFFRVQFDVLLKILDVLEIPVPKLPSKADKRGRLLLYNDLCNLISKFAEINDLTPEETCACLYDFSLILMEENDKQIEMPEPTNIWLTGGSKKDYKTFLENFDKSSKSVWSCNENTRRGDIIIMYVLAPYSCIQSIWRADIDGVFTPFDYYNSRARIANGIMIQPIKLIELKSDKYFSQLPITLKNFQGVNGVKFSARDYSELQRLLKDKGFDVSVLPQLYNPNLEYVKEVKVEKDVEEKLLIPLLEKLGYSDADWTRQLSQKAGRKEKAIPDFVFMPKGDVHFQNAPMIIEAKYDMSSNIERTKSYNQALSYARMMRSSVFGICDKDRFILYKGKKGHFDRFNPVFEKHWQSINDVEVFSQLKTLIGKHVLE